VIRLLAVDIDGTLLDSRGRVPASHRTALADAAAAGLRVVLVTGRTFQFSRPVAAALALPSTLIVNNGAVVKTPGGRTLRRAVLPRAAARAVLASTAAFEDSVALVFDRAPAAGAGEIVCDRMDWTHPNRAGYYEKNRAFIAATSPLTAALTEDPIQVMFNGEVEPMRALAERLRALSIADQFSVAVTEYPLRDFSLVDVNAAGCSKGRTLARWADGLGIRADEVMAVGDNLNDLDMLDYAGVPVVMGNAAAALKAHGYHVTGSHDEDGLADAIYRFALASASPSGGEARRLPERA
jgi:hypothetical protein